MSSTRVSFSSTLAFAALLIPILALASDTAPSDTVTPDTVQSDTVRSDTPAPGWPARSTLVIPESQDGIPALPPPLSVTGFSQSRVL